MGSNARAGNIGKSTLNDVSHLRNRIAFMHIPKTAGISVIDAFFERLGSHNCLSFSPTIGDEDFREKRFVSGHVYLGEITQQSFIFSFFRDPLKQLVSHLLWIDHYNMPEYEHEALGFSASVQQAIELLKPVDFSNAKDIDQYLRQVSSDSDLRIKNLQSEMLSFRRGEVPPVEDRALAKMAISALDRLAFIGMSEYVDEDIAVLFNELDLGPAPTVKKLNATPSLNMIDLTIPSIRRVLQSYVEADLRLYEHILRMREKSGAVSFLGAFKGIFSAFTG